MHRDARVISPRKMARLRFARNIPSVLFSMILLRTGRMIIMQIALLVREVNHRFPYRKSAFGRWIRIVELEITREACIYICVCDEF